jgi:hypothetical protein
MYIKRRLVIHTLAIVNCVLRKCTESMTGSGNPAFPSSEKTNGNDV